MTDYNAEKVSRTDCQPWHDEETLRYFYHGKGYSLLETAEAVGCTEGTISQWCDRLGVETRSVSEARTQDAPEELTNADRLRELYHGEGMTTYEIADEVGYTSKGVHNWLDKHDIETRPPFGLSERVSTVCVACGDEYEVIRSRSDDAKYCSRECYYEDMDMPTGEDHWSWNGGVFDYGPGWTEEKRQQVRCRDGLECQDCGLSQDEQIERDGCRLHVHHMVDPRDSTNPAVYNAPRNLVTLCNSCHRSRHAE